MHLSCNGCRVLRKGCSEDCIIRPCLEWITSPESQANATLFLAKFYGRAGLLNLINAGPPHLRPSIFKSLLHEACGRIVNPVHGSAGLVSTGSWQQCQAAVESVLSGSPISESPPMDSCADDVSSPFKACDIRHVAKEEKALARSGTYRKFKNRTGIKRSRAKPNLEVVAEPSGDDDSVGCGDSKASRSGAASELASVETVEDTLAKPNGVINVGPELELGLSLFPVSKAQKEEDTKEETMNDSDEATWTCDLKLGLKE